MIRRNAAQYTKNQESLKQHSFTAMRGVDSSKAPTQPDTVLNTLNLDVDYDGGLILRKPLLLKRKYTNDSEFKIHTSYDKSVKIKTDKALTIFSDTDSSIFDISNIVLTDIFGIKTTIEFETSTFDLLDFTNCKISNTNTSVVISNVYVKLLEMSNKYKLDLYNKKSEPSNQYRLFKVYYTDCWNLEMLTPEMNTIAYDTLALDFNTTLNYSYAIRDNYHASATEISGILAYVGDVSKNLVFEKNSKNFKFTYTDDTFKETVYVHEYLAFEVTTTKYTDYVKLWFKPIIGYGEHYLFKKIEIQMPDEQGNWNWQDMYRTDRYSHITDVSLHSVNYKKPITSDNPYIEFSIYFEIAHTGDFLKELTISEITETDKYFKLTESIEVSNSSICVLKAFINKPDTIDDIYVKWERSLDGVSWELAEPYYAVPGEELPDKHTVYTLEIDTNLLDNSKNLKWKPETYYKLDLPSTDLLDYPKHNIVARPDCLILESLPSTALYVYRCTMIKAKKGSAYSPPEGETDGSYYCKDIELSSKTYTFKSNSSTFENVVKNPISSSFMYWKHSLYTTDSSYVNVYASNPDSAIFPISRIIDLGTFEGNTVRKLIPWRDYLIAFTDNTVHLIQEQDTGFTTKVINTFIGTTERDADTCVATLNGIVFKSGSKLYSITPNVNSGDETIFNVSEISKPIEHILDKLSYNDEYKPFAFTTPEAYYLFVPNNVDTFCLKYNYTLRVWTQYKYPVLLYKYEMLNVSDIRVFSRTADGIVEYYFEKEPNDVGELQPYGDFLTTEKDSEKAYKISPIEFFVDSGQKTDNLSLTKQFVESKIIVATLSNKDNFEMDVQIAIEGNTFNKHVDINTDGALVRNASDQILTLGTVSNITDSADTFNTMRQVFLRYSGRGKTIRHIIKGSSLYKFKIYETFYRFKILNVKQ